MYKLASIKHKFWHKIYHGTQLGKPQILLLTTKHFLLQITRYDIFLKAWICLWISHVLDSQSWCDSKVHKLSNLLVMGWTTKKPCTSDEKSIKNWKNQLDFIWKDFTSRSQWNKSHSIQRCISWDSVENEFSQSMMKSWSHEVRWMKKLEVGWKNVFVT